MTIVTAQSADIRSLFEILHQSLNQHCNLSFGYPTRSLLRLLPTPKWVPVTRDTMTIHGQPSIYRHEPNRKSTSKSRSPKTQCCLASSHTCHSLASRVDSEAPMRFSQGSTGIATSNSGILKLLKYCLDVKKTSQSTGFVDVWFQQWWRVVGWE